MRDWFRRLWAWIRRERYDEADEEITYTITKRGVLETITDEATLADLRASTRTWGDNNANLMYQRLLDHYDESSEWYPKAWATRDNVSDFRNRHWMRFGSYGEMPVANWGSAGRLPPDVGRETKRTLHEFVSAIQRGEQPPNVSIRGTAERV